MSIFRALPAVDWVFIFWYIVVALTVGFMYSRKGTKSLSDYFISGRSLPWWIAGTSMVATTFGVSTPLIISEFIWTGGIEKNWWWFTLIVGNMVTIFFFARLWRRAHVLSDVELTEVRYSGKAAAVLRGFRGGFFGIVMNCLILGWENVAMGTVLKVVFGLELWQGLIIAFVLTVGYTVLAGFWGVVMTDMVQFSMAMVASLVLGVISWKVVGGLEGVRHGLAVLGGEGTWGRCRDIPFFAEVARTTGAGLSTVGDMFGALPATLSQLMAKGFESLGSGLHALGHSAPQSWKLNFFPDFTVSGVGRMTLLTFVVYAAVKWWAAWYPGSEPGGGGYVAQRMFASKNEKNSLLSTLWFTFCHYVVRPWPWIMTALAALVIFGIPGDITATRGAEGFVRMIVSYMPIGMRGLMLAALLGAFMSTVDTHLSWGASYLINDVYKRFLARGRSDHHYVRASQICVVLIAILMLGVATLLEDISSANFLLVSMGAGAGLVYILRWYWWRINAWI